MHPGSNKMYRDLKQRFWWTRMKRKIAKYVSNVTSPKASRYASPLEHPGLEVGRYTHGFRGGFASHSEGL
ncbi:hypothetical protein U9M48_016699 [Paspalum notatum var. saurae]|uniref:Integrase zinc-binding domain-containing protein n=1 Tax=Paspalum notatum var. saurae TaxID=547442 RepID=A0AAQ3T5Z0_PASNO